MASGGQQPNFRFYFHAQLTNEDVRLLVEMIVNTAAGTLSMTVKSDASASTVSKFAALLSETVNSL